LFILDWYAKYSILLTLSAIEILVYCVLVQYKNWLCLHGKMSSEGSVIFVCFCFYQHYICPIGVKCERAPFWHRRRGKPQSFQIAPVNSFLELLLASWHKCGYWLTEIL